jgi:hypothetical protein
MQQHVMVDNAYAKIDGVLRRAEKGTHRTVLAQTHPRRSSFESAGAWPMTAADQLGIDTFAFNNRHSNSPAGIDVSTQWEPLALDVAAAVQELRERGYERIILYGTSAGGPLMAFYQCVAERGNAVFGERRTLSGFRGFFDTAGRPQTLPTADGLVFQNATSGTATSFLLRLDGSVIEERDVVRDPALDMFEPANGYDPDTGLATYGAGFLARYHVAQARRMNALILGAQELLDRIRSLRRPFEDDQFRVIAGVRAFPAFIDLSLARVTEHAWPIVPDGGTTPVHSTRPPLADAGRTNRSRAQGTTVHTLESFLSYRAVWTDPERFDPYATRAEESGVDGGTTNTAAAENLAGVSVPLLLTGATADVEVHLPTSELLLHAAGSADRSLLFVRDADHGMKHGSGDSHRPRTAHLQAVREWIDERFS